MGQKFSNNARSRLVGSLSSSATSFTVESATADLFPIANTTDWLTVNDWFKAVLEDSSGNIEIVHVGSRNSGSGLLTNVLRGQEGTTARTFNAGSTLSLRLTAADFETALAKFEDVTAFMLTLMDDADAAAARTTLGATTVGSDLFTAADAAAARTTLDVPTRTGTNASGAWNIEAATALLAANAQLLDGIDSTGFTRSTGTSELGNVARTNGNLAGGFAGGLQLRNAGGGANTKTFIDFILHNVPNAHIFGTDTGIGGSQLEFGTTPPGDPAVDRRVTYGKLRNDGVWEGRGFTDTQRYWRNASRARDTTYQNTTGKDMELCVTFMGRAGRVYVGTSPSGLVHVSGNTSSLSNDTNARAVHCVTVPSNHYYRMTDADLNLVSELY